MTFYDRIGTYNIEFRYSSPTFTIGAVGGRDLSSSNPGYVVMPGTTAGTLIRVAVTSNQDFVDNGGSSEILNNTFGTTSGTAWADDVPFFVYAVTNDAEDSIAFMIGRYPNLKNSPGAADIGAPDDAVADKEEALFSLENIDESLFDINSCLNVGSIRMTKTSSDDWTVQALDYKDGVGRFNDSRYFDMPLAQNGAASGTFFKANGGTAPIFTTNQYSYTISKDGICTVWGNIRNDGGTDGSGAVTAQVSIPYKPISTSTGGNNLFMANINNPSVSFVFHIVDVNLVNDDIEFIAEGGAKVQNGDFSAGDRDVIFSGTYPIEGFNE